MSMAREKIVLVVSPAAVSQSVSGRPESIAKLMLPTEGSFQCSVRMSEVAPAEESIKDGQIVARCWCETETFD